MTSVETRGRSRDETSGKILATVTWAVLAVVMLALPGAVLAQSAGDGYEVPRTVWGDPDLQGNWTNATLTPFERPEGQGPTMTPAEAAAMEGRAEERFLEGLEPSDPDREAPPVGGDGSTGAAGMVGGYNRVYIDPGSTVAMIDGQYRTSLVTRPADGQVPDVTPEGRELMRQARAGRAGHGPYDHPEMRPFGERCVISFGTMAGPPMLPNGFYNNNYTIVQGEDHIAIMTEMVHDTRIIRMGEPEPVPGSVKPWFGVSYGHWDGETLVIETTNINPAQTLRGVPPSDEMKVTERLTRVSDDKIVYGFTVDDPVTFEEPWGGEIPFQALDGQIYEYACHEGNYALYNVLSGARYQERLEERGEADSQDEVEQR